MDNWLLQYNASNELITESYKCFLDRLTCLDLSMISTDEKESKVPLTSDDAVLFQEVKILLNKIRQNGTVKFDDGTELTLQIFSEHLQMSDLSVESFSIED